MFHHILGDRQGLTNRDIFDSLHCVKQIHIRLSSDSDSFRHNFNIPMSESPTLPQEATSSKKVTLNNTKSKPTPTTDSLSSIYKGKKFQDFTPSAKPVTIEATTTKKSDVVQDHDSQTHSQTKPAAKTHKKKPAQTKPVKPTQAEAATSGEIVLNAPHVSSSEKLPLRKQRQKSAKNPSHDSKSEPKPESSHPTSKGKFKNINPIQSELVSLTPSDTTVSTNEKKASTENARKKKVESFTQKHKSLYRGQGNPLQTVLTNQLVDMEKDLSTTQSGRVRHQTNKRKHTAAALKADDPSVLSRTAPFTMHGGLHSGSVELITQLATETFTCAICMDIITSNEEIWSCEQCRKIIHFNCALDWAVSHEDRTFGGVSSQHVGNDPLAPTQNSNARQNTLHPASNILGFRDRRSTVSWPCPLCNFLADGIPTEPTCFCGQSIRPKSSRLLLPHACFNSCDRPLSSDEARCPHKCSLPCHPGPCISCSAHSNPVDCWCGKDKVIVRCGDMSLSSRVYPSPTSITSIDGIPNTPASSLADPEQMTLIRSLPSSSIQARSCQSTCGKLLLSPLAKNRHCMLHKCSKSCHPGDCGVCSFEEKVSCFCGKHVNVSRPCGFSASVKARKAPSGSSLPDIFACGEICSKTLGCGNHKCTLPCHDGPCQPCQRLPSSDSTMSRCACGKSSGPAFQAIIQSSVRRTSCLDPLPSCNIKCNRVLDCGTHHCQEVCHEGVCAPCQDTTAFPCRCSKAKKSVLPCQVQIFARDALFSASSVLDSNTLKTKGMVLEVKIQVLSGDESSSLSPNHSTYNVTGNVYLTTKLASGVSTGNCVELSSPTETRSAVFTMKPMILKNIPSFTVPASNTLDFSLELGDPVLLCHRQCSSNLSCQKHQCKSRCCPDTKGSTYREVYSAPHNCAQQTCNMNRPCGHPCLLACHPGPCPPCNFVYRHGLQCPCGRTSLPPGTKCMPHQRELLTQSCQFRCDVIMECGHRCLSGCHEGPHPPCRVPTNRECIGGHGTQFKNIPCNLRTVKCSLVCKKPRSCHRHFCEESCHDGPCPTDDMNNSQATEAETSTSTSPHSKTSCERICSKIRSFCHHKCTKPCHDDIDGGDFNESLVGDKTSTTCGSCETKVDIYCICGKIKKSALCGISPASGTKLSSTMEAIMPIERAKYIQQRCVELASKETKKSVMELASKLLLRLVKLRKELHILTSMVRVRLLEVLFDVSVDISLLPLLDDGNFVNEEDNVVEFSITCLSNQEKDQNMKDVANMSHQLKFTMNHSPFTAMTPSSTSSVSLQELYDSFDMSPGRLVFENMVLTCADITDEIQRHTGLCPSVSPNFATLMDDFLQKLRHSLETINELEQILLNPPTSCIVSPESISTSHSFSDESMKLNLPALLHQYCTNPELLTKSDENSSDNILTLGEIPPSYQLVPCDPAICSKQFVKIAVGPHILHTSQPLSFPYSAKDIAHLASRFVTDDIDVIERDIADFCSSWEHSMTFRSMLSEERSLCHTVAHFYGLETASLLVNHSYREKQVQVIRTMRITIPPVSIAKAVDVFRKHGKIGLCDDSGSTFFPVEK